MFTARPIRPDRGPAEPRRACPWRGRGLRRPGEQRFGVVQGADGALALPERPELSWQTARPGHPVAAPKAPRAAEGLAMPLRATAAVLAGAVLAATHALPMPDDPVSVRPRRRLLLPEPIIMAVTPGTGGVGLRRPGTRPAACSGSGTRIFSWR
jgi:hypothetical protein